MIEHLTERCWNTDDESCTKLIGKVDFISWVPFNELNARDRVSDLDHGDDGRITECTIDAAE